MPFEQVTLAQLRTRLKTKWDNTTGLPILFWTDAEADFAINEALQWYNLYTGVWRKRVTLSTVADQVYYSLPATMVYNARMEYNGLTLPMSSLTDLSNGQPAWEGETTADVALPSRIMVWAPVGMNQFVVWPADAIGQNSLTIDGVHDTPVLVADTDTLDLDDSEIDALLGEALFIATFKDAAKFVRAQAWHQEFLATVMAHNARLSASDAFRRYAGTDATRTLRPLAVTDHD